MKKILTILSILVLASCTTLKDAKDAKGKGVKQTYNKPYELVWDKTIEVIQESKLDLISKDKESGDILAQKAMSAFSYGENVAVFIEKKDESSTTVEVVSKRALPGNITAKDWTNHVFQELNKKLK